MNMGSLIAGLMVQTGPTELYMPEPGMADGGVGGVLLWFGVLVGVVLIGVWARGMAQRRVDPRELAFRSMARRLNLSHKQTAGIRAMAASSGVHPVGLLMSPTALRESARQ